MSSKVLPLAVICALSCALIGAAQTNTARLSGLLTDVTGAVLPGGQITALNTETGIPRTVSTDERGRFVVPQLPPGSYQVTATMQGFETLVRTEITLSVGQEANLTLQMTVGAVTEEVTVTGGAPLVNTTSSAVSGVIEQLRIEQLPLNGRDFTQLALVQPGVFLARKTDAGGSKGFGTRISMAGSRVDQTAWFLDGTNIRGNALFGVPGSAAGLVLGVDAIREFQVLTSNLSAEFGGTSGGVINMISKSGTNEFHGSLYEFLRNDNFDARNFFDRDPANPLKRSRAPEFKRNQFGASLGGPIKRDKTFFFGNYEGLREGRGETKFATVPDELVHNGLIPATGGGRQQIVVAPQIRPFLDLYPLPNGPAVGANSGLSQLITPVTNVTDENYVIARIDHRLTASQNLFGRFTFDEGTQVIPDSLRLIHDSNFTATRYATVQHQYVISSQLLATTRVAFNRSITETIVKYLADLPRTIYIFEDGPANVGFTGATGINFGRDPQRWVQNLYQISEDVGYLRGSHSLKFGFDFQKFGFNYKPEGDLRKGSFGWANLRNFLDDARLQTFGVPATGSSQVRSLRQNYFGFYFQDDWKLRPALTINAGVRYEPYTVPTEKWGRLSTVRDWRTATRYETDIPFFQNFTKKNISPRSGFAWNPGGDGKTAVRGGFGLFFVPIEGPHYRTQSARNPPFYALIQQPVGEATLGTARADVAAVERGLLTPIMNPNTFMQLPEYYLKSPYEMKFNLSVERELAGAISVGLAYIGGRGIHLWRLDSCNTAPSVIVGGRAFVAPNTPRPNPNLGSCAINYSDAQSFYNGLHSEVKKRFGHGLQLQSSYTWSKAIDDSTTGNVSSDYGEGGSSEPGNRKADRGLSAIHVGQNLTINGIYVIPFPQGSPLLSRVFGGWQMSAIFSAASGNPFSVRSSGTNAPDLNRSTGRQRPDLLPGRNNANIVSGTTVGCQGSGGGTVYTAGQKLGTPDLYFDPCAFALPPPGYYGNAGRNILIGPGLQTFDLSLQKTIPLGFSEGSRLEFRAEGFNVFNRANLGSPSEQVLNPSNRTFIAGAGLITATTTTSRQMQFGLKLVF